MKAVTVTTALALAALSSAAVAEPLTLTMAQMDEITAGVVYEYHPGYAQNYQAQAYYNQDGVFYPIEGPFAPGTDYQYDQVYFAVPYVTNDPYAASYYGVTYVYAYVPYPPQGYTLPPPSSPGT